MKIGVTGVTGLLGEAFERLLSQKFEVTAITRNEMDLADLDGIKSYLDENDFDVLINPAVLGLEHCLDDPKLAHVVNAEAPGVMAEICQQKGTKFVHFSTDYVFGGESEGQWNEQADADAVNDYGVTKRAGELAVLEYPSHLVCRVSWIFGPGRDTLIDQVVTKAQAGEQLNFIADKWSIPTHADAIVSAVEQLIEKGCEGLYHTCSKNEPVTWWDYADGVMEIAYQLGLLANKPNVGKMKLSDMKAFRSPRPRHTAMSVEKLSAIGIEMPSWKESAKTYLQQKFTLESV